MEGNSRQARRAAARAVRALCWGALGLALGGCGKPLSPGGIAWPKALASRRTVGAAPVGAPAQATLRTFALYALLEPLIDGDSPPRWADPSESFECDAHQVTVDGAPLDVGAPVGDGSFTVRWHMQRCKALDDYTQFTGDIVMHVQASGASYRAVVQPATFEVVCPYGRETWTEPFEARMSIRR